jgi:xanthine dehydrogenase accessory factor
MESAKGIYQKLAGFVAEGTPVAVATVVRVRGSVPREVGTKMIVHPAGRHVGTVGGGCGEADVIRAALDVIDTGQPQIVQVDLTEDISMQSLGVCGGIMEVYVERWPSANQADADQDPLRQSLPAGDSRHGR